jgi:ribonuclease VapC
VVIDTSALIAILQTEPEAETFIRAIVRDSRRLVSVVTVLEAEMVTYGRAGEDGVVLLELVLQKLKCETVACTLDQLAASRRAFRRFGKGRHPAGLNLGEAIPSRRAARPSELERSHAGMNRLGVGRNFLRGDFQRVASSRAHDDPRARSREGRSTGKADSAASTVSSDRLRSFGTSTLDQLADPRFRILDLPRCHLKPPFCPI